MTGSSEFSRTPRDAYLRVSGVESLEQLLRDSAFVRAGDLASLAFCNAWTNTPDDGCGYSMRLDRRSLTIVPDPFGGRVIEISIDVHEFRISDFGRRTTPEQSSREHR